MADGACCILANAADESTIGERPLFVFLLLSGNFNGTFVRIPTIILLLNFVEQLVNLTISFPFLTIDSA